MTNRLRGADAASLTREKLMNIKQMKRAISTFRSADVSILKDDALRAKAQKLQAKQKGFTLLELLVVITLLATLATAALVAYDGIGENARDASAATALTTLEGTLRNYRVIEGEYPEQFDSLANADAGLVDASGADVGAMQLMSDETKAFFGQLVISKTIADDVVANEPVAHAIADALREAGLEELQAVQGATTWATGFVPNLAMNESYLPATTVNAGTELGFPVVDASGAINYGGVAVLAGGAALSIVPSFGDAACTVAFSTPASITAAFDASTVSDNTRLNLISDALDDDQCSLVVAVGVGKDVPGATLGKSVEIGQVPTVGTNDVNPKNSYARAIALFLVAKDEGEDDSIDLTDVLPKARLIGLVDPEGRTIDEIVAAATAATDDDEG